MFKFVTGFFYSSADNVEKNQDQKNQDQRQTEIAVLVLESIRNIDVERFSELVKEDSFSPEKIDFLNPTPLNKDDWLKFCRNLPVTEDLKPVIKYLGIKRKLDNAQNKLHSGDVDVQGIKSKIDILEKELIKAKAEFDNSRWEVVDPEASEGADRSSQESISLS
ncbi:MAG: hypothetical protein QNK11_00425 [Legionella sp.]|nr:hypothetical protein [Legionella sp.]